MVAINIAIIATNVVPETTPTQPVPPGVAAGKSPTSSSTLQCSLITNSIAKLKVVYCIIARIISSSRLLPPHNKASPCCSPGSPNGLMARVYDLACILHPVAWYPQHHDYCLRSCCDNLLAPLGAPQCGQGGADRRRAPLKLDGH